MELSDYRRQIDDIDSQLLALFYRRMDVAAQIGGYKKAHGLPALDAGRERAKLQQIADSAPEALRDYTVSLYSLMFELSRSCQNRLLGITSPLTAEIEHAIAHTPPLFPEHPAVACQGVEGAYSQLACDRLFTLPNVFTVRRLMRCSPPLRRACAATVSSRWKTARRLGQRGVRSHDAPQLPHRAAACA